jgi:cbb3-type cytochrome oxidase subunit 3
MFSDTGNLSFWLGVVFILISLCGIVIIYLKIKNKSIENANIDKIIEQGKWVIVSVAITLSASIVNDGFREREQDIKEIGVFDKYTNIVLEASNIEKRRLLCEYFASVSPEGPIRKSWEKYKIVVDKHIDDHCTRQNHIG